MEYNYQRFKYYFNKICTENFSLGCTNQKEFEHKVCEGNGSHFL